MERRKGIASVVDGRRSIGQGQLTAYAGTIPIYTHVEQLAYTEGLSSWCLSDRNPYESKLQNNNSNLRHLQSPSSSASSSLSVQICITPVTEITHGYTQNMTDSKQFDGNKVEHEIKL